MRGFKVAARPSFTISVPLVGFSEPTASHRNPSGSSQGMSMKAQSVAYLMRLLMPRSFCSGSPCETENQSIQSTTFVLRTRSVNDKMRIMLDARMCSVGAQNAVCVCARALYLALVFIHTSGSVYVLQCDE